LKTPQLNFRLAGEGASKYTQQKAQALISEIMQNSSFLRSPPNKASLILDRTLKTSPCDTMNYGVFHAAPVH
jgi:hypothetical protein